METRGRKKFYHDRLPDSTLSEATLLLDDVKRQLIRLHNTNILMLGKTDRKTRIVKNMIKKVCELSKDYNKKS